MKQNFTKLLLGVMFFSGFFGIMTNNANAANLNYSADTLVVIGSATYIIASGSAATSVVVGATTLTATVPSGSTFTFRSTNRYLLNNDQNIIQTCSSGDNQIIIDGTAVPGPVVITPNVSSQCTIPGGSVGGAVPVPTPTPTPTPTPSSGGVHANGTLVLGSDSKTVYLIKDGQRYAFRDAAEYLSHGFNFSQIVPASNADNALPLAAGNIVKALEGTLVIDSRDGKTVYMIGLGNTKRGFASAAVFTALGYKFGNLPSINLTDYATGPVIDSSTAPHPEGSLVRQSNGTVWWILNGKRQGFESLAVFNTYGFVTTRLVLINTADLALPEGPLVKFRNGTLVNDGGVYYIISDGLKLQFSSLTVLTAMGYKASNAITASLANYTAGQVIQ